MCVILDPPSHDSQTWMKQDSRLMQMVNLATMVARLTSGQGNIEAQVRELMTFIEAMSVPATIRLHIANVLISNNAIDEARSIIAKLDPGQFLQNASFPKHIGQLLTALICVSRPDELLRLLESPRWRTSIPDNVRLTLVANALKGGWRGVALKLCDGMNTMPSDAKMRIRFATSLVQLNKLDDAVRILDSMEMDVDVAKLMISILKAQGLPDKICGVVRRFRTCSPSGDDLLFIEMSAAFHSGDFHTTIRLADQFASTKANFLAEFFSFIASLCLKTLDDFEDAVTRILRLRVLMASATPPAKCLHWFLHTLVLLALRKPKEALAACLDGAAASNFPANPCAGLLFLMENRPVARKEALRFLKATLAAFAPTQLTCPLRLALAAKLCEKAGLSNLARLVVLKKLVQMPALERKARTKLEAALKSGVKWESPEATATLARAIFPDGAEGSVLRASLTGMVTIDPGRLVSNDLVQWQSAHV